MTILAALLTTVLFLLGILGTIFPLLPGPVLIWLGMLLFGILSGFGNLTPFFYILQGIAVILVMAVDYVATATGTRRLGGSKTAMWGAVAGLLLGLIALGPAGIIFGPFLGAFIGEMLRGLPLKTALRSSFGSLIGLLGGIILKLAIEMVMIFWFIQRILS